MLYIHTFNFVHLKTQLRKWYNCCYYYFKGITQYYPVNH